MVDFQGAKPPAEAEEVADEDISENYEGVRENDGRTGEPRCTLCRKKWGVCLKPGAFGHLPAGGSGTPATAKAPLPSTGVNKRQRGSKEARRHGQAPGRKKRLKKQKTGDGPAAAGAQCPRNPVCGRENRHSGHCGKWRTQDTGDIVDGAAPSAPGPASGAARNSNSLKNLKTTIEQAEQCIEQAKQWVPLLKIHIA